MIYLKSYKLFESVENKSTEVEVTINHILYELSDENFDVDFNLWKVEGDKLSFEITIGKSNIVPDGWGGEGSEVREEFNWSNISDVMDRFCYYLFTISSDVQFGYDDSHDEHCHYNINNYNDLLAKMEQDFPEYYNEYEGWFRIGFVISTKDYMENKIKVTLPDNLIDKLIELPEQGMGYQIVDLLLVNGQELKNKFVFNSSVLELEENEMINVKDIVSISIHKK
jgi:hypothetical protein